MVLWLLLGGARELNVLCVVVGQAFPEPLLRRGREQDEGGPEVFQSVPCALHPAVGTVVGAGVTAEAGAAEGSRISQPRLP